MSENRAKHVNLTPAQSLIDGLNLVANAVRPTLGPAGQFVLLEQDLANVPPVLTKDGVTVAMAVQTRNSEAHAAIRTVVTAAREMAHRVGDGTTSAVLMTTALASGLLQHTRMGDHRAVLNYLADYVEQGVALIAKRATPVEATRKSMKAIATISCNNDPMLGDLVADAVSQVGNDGVVTFEGSPTGEHWVEAQQGLHFNQGFISPHFVTDRNRGLCSMRNVLILLTDRTLSNANDLVPALEHALKAGMSLLVIAADVVDDALTVMLRNLPALPASVRICAVRAPKFGIRKFEAFQDIALMTDGHVITDADGQDLKAMTSDDVGLLLGRAAQVTVMRGQTIISGTPGNAEAIAAAAQRIREELLHTNHDQMEHSHLKERLARLTGGVANIFVGGANDTQCRANCFLVEDAVNACFAALRGGIVPGGGLAYSWVADHIRRNEPKNLAERTAQEIFYAALSAPILALLANALEQGKPQDRTHAHFAKLLETSHKKHTVGYNVVTGRFEDLMKARIWEPAEVPINVLKLSFGSGTTLGLTAVTITRDGEPLT